MRALPSDLEERSLELLNRLRNALPNADATYLGTLDPARELSIVEAYLYIRRRRLGVRAELYQEVQRHVLTVLDWL